jgi:4-amino-4-deoxy-L-arabinose transferase-like glycosyltransferase
MKRTELLVFLLVMAIAIGFRFAKLDSVPPGLYPDEAMNGNNALQALDSGDFKLFYPENNGREGLFINIQALSVHLFGNTPIALRSVSAIFGVLTVLGTYFLTRRLFDDWKLAAIAAFLMATGFWHVNFSRIGFRAIMAPFVAVWGFYYLYKGIETHRLWHWGLAGLFFGLGFHTYIAYRVMPLAVILVLIAYWWALRHTFWHGKYAFARHQMLGGVAAMAAIITLVALPMAAHFYSNPDDWGGRTEKVSVFASDHPIRDLGRNIGLTLGMFLVHGDNNWRHNIPGEPILFWPVAAMFAAGLVHTIWRLGHSIATRGHPGVAHTLVLAWFGVALLPGILSNEGIPHALRVITAAPPVYILAALGLHWFYTWLYRWYASRDVHKICLPGPYGHRWCAGEGALVVSIAVIALLIAIAVGDGGRYFSRWANHPDVSREFTSHYLAIAQRLNELPPATLKYVIVSRGDVLVNGIPVSAQTVMYLTDTSTPEKQDAKHIYYLTPEQLTRTTLPRGSFIIRLDP